MTRACKLPRLGRTEIRSQIANVAPVIGRIRWTRQCLTVSTIKNNPSVSLKPHARTMFSKESKVGPEYDVPLSCKVFLEAYLLASQKDYLDEPAQRIECEVRIAQFELMC